MNAVAFKKLKHSIVTKQVPHKCPTQLLQSLPPLPSSSTPALKLLTALADHFSWTVLSLRPKHKRKNCCMSSAPQILRLSFLDCVTGLRVSCISRIRATGIRTAKDSAYKSHSTGNTDSRNWSPLSSGNPYFLEETREPPQIPS